MQEFNRASIFSMKKGEKFTKIKDILNSKIILKLNFLVKNIKISINGRSQSKWLYEPENFLYKKEILTFGKFFISVEVYLIIINEAIFKTLKHILRFKGKGWRIEKG